jgi:hypothetical protein
MPQGERSPRRRGHCHQMRAISQKKGPRLCRERGQVIERKTTARLKDRSPGTLSRLHKKAPSHENGARCYWPPHHNPVDGFRHFRIRHLLGFLNTQRSAAGISHDGLATLPSSLPPNASDLSPASHPPMRRVLASFEPCWLGGATGRGAEPTM